MDTLTHPDDRPLPRPRAPIPAAGASPLRGVRGWLLLLCWMLTVVGPLACLALVVTEYRHIAARAAESPGVLAATVVWIAITASSVAFGMHAGLRLWRIRPRAVEVAKASLLFGLAAEWVATAIESAIAPGASGAGMLSYGAVAGLVPGLVFFTVCFGYLNKSARVAATYTHA